MNNTVEKIDEQPARAKAWVDSLELDYKAVFVPQSQSRNKDEKQRSLNWRVSLGPLTTDYMQGIGHVPGYKFNQRRTLEVVTRENVAAERGRYFPDTARSFHVGGKPIPAPELDDVLYCLISDASVLDYATFEEWADDFGYDTDSRKAEQIYRDCLALALQLRSFIDLDAAREAFKDY